MSSSYMDGVPGLFSNNLKDAPWTGVVPCPLSLRPFEMLMILRNILSMLIIGFLRFLFFFLLYARLDFDMENPYMTNITSIIEIG